MTTLTMTAAATGLRDRLRPSREQLRVAAAMFAVAPEEVTSVVVPVVVRVLLPSQGSSQGAASRPAERVEHPGGYWLADRSTREGAYSYSVARDAAEAAAEAHLRALGQGGLPGSVSIRPDGTWQC